MAKTLVIKLAETIDNDNLRKLGEMRFKIKPISTVNPSYTPSQYSQKMTVSVSEPTTLEITGDGYFTDSTLTQNLGKTLRTQTGSNDIYVSDGDYALSLFNKYAITTMNMPYTNQAGTYTNHYHWGVNLADFNGMDALTSLNLHYAGTYGSLTNVGRLYNLSTLNVIANTTHITGDLADIAGLTALKSLNLFQASMITGDISSLAGMTELTYADLRYCSKLTGNTSSIASLHPNNGGKLATLVYSGTQVTGDWPPSA